MSGKVQEATNILQNAVTLCKKEGDDEGQRTALQHLIRLNLQGNNHALAINYLEESIELLDSGNDVEEFKLLAQLTKACAQNQDFNKATHVGEKAMEMISVNEDKALALALFHSLGISYMKTDESGKALQNLELALNLCQKVPNHPLKPELF